MPAKIGLGDVATQLLRWSMDNMDTSGFLDKDGSARIAYRQFRTAMLRDDFIASEPTIRKKWQLLSATGVISVGRGDVGVIYWDSLKVFSTPSVVAYCESVVENEKTKKQKNKNTEEAVA